MWASANYENSLSIVIGTSEEKKKICWFEFDCQLLFLCFWLFSVLDFGWESIVTYLVFG